MMDAGDDVAQELLFGGVTRSDPRPGDILAMNILGRDDPLPGERCASLTLALRYYSDAAGGAHIVAKLQLPLGEPPPEGWPVSVFAHGMGDPAMDFRRWPFVRKDWRRTRGQMAGRWANHGIATLIPWLPGAGPSQPFATFSPFSLDRTQRAIIDGCTALQGLAQECRLRPEMKRVLPLAQALSMDRLVLRADCVSTVALVHLAASRHKHASLSGLQVFVFDDFQPSHAYNFAFLHRPMCELPPAAAAAAWSIYARTRWSLAEAQGWPGETFFSPRACEFLSVKISLPLGPRPRVYALPLAPKEPDSLGGELLQAVRSDLNRTPTAIELRDWLFGGEFRRWMQLPSLSAMVSDEFYRRTSAATDPFFAENIAPFSPGVPLFVAARTDASLIGGLPSLANRFQNMTLPRVRTLQSWGWDVRLIVLEPDGGTSFSGGSAQRAVLEGVEQIVRCSG